MQYPGRTGPIQNDAAPFSPEMVQGSIPPRNRAFIAKVGWSTSQTTQTDAPFSPEMSAGQKPDRARNWLPLRTGLSIWISDITPFAFEGIFDASRPQRARIFLAPRIPGPLAQTTPIAAPFSTEMVQGWHPDAPRLPFTSKRDWSINQTTPVDAPFSQEMIAGQHPDRSRDWLPLRTGLSISQTTPVAAPFSMEMVQGWQPIRQRGYLPPQGWTWINNDTVIQLFQPEWATNINVFIAIPQSQPIER